MGDGRYGRKTWLILIIVWATIELIALFSKGRHLSFSEWCREITGQYPTHRDRKIRAGLLTGLLVWFYGHIVFGWGPSLTEDNHLTWRGINYDAVLKDVARD